MNHCFESQFNKFTFSKFIKVSIQNTMIHSSSNFLTQFKAYVDKILGSKLVNKVTIEKYKMNFNIINCIGVIISFNVPVSYGYLDDFKFPSNWFLIPFILQQRFRNGSKYALSQNQYNKKKNQNNNKKQQQWNHNKAAKRKQSTV